MKENFFEHENFEVRVVRERQLRLYGHVARLPAVDPAHRILSCRDPDGGEYGHDGPGVCLGDGQMEVYLKDMGMTGLASARAMAKRRFI